MKAADKLSFCLPQKKRQRKHMTSKLIFAVGYIGVQVSPQCNNYLRISGIGANWGLAREVVVSKKTIKLKEMEILECSEDSSNV